MASAAAVINTSATKASRHFPDNASIRVSPVSHVRLRQLVVGVCGRLRANRHTSVAIPIGQRHSVRSHSR